jgi:D-3-phosphoglycerate dehydrogenase
MALRIVAPGDYPLQVAGSPHLERLGPYGVVTVYPDIPSSIEERIARVQGADVVINSHGSMRWPAEVLERLRGVRLFALCSVGTDAVDLEAAARLGILVCNQGDSTAAIVAEHEFALMLATARRLGDSTREIRAGRWPEVQLVTLRGKTAGIIGTGNSGLQMARLCTLLGMEVVAWSFHPRRAQAEVIGFRYLEFDDVLRQADVVSLHVGLSESTRGMVGRAQLAMMKRGSILVNGSRGGVVDTDALVEALASGHVGGAGLDVFEPEPLPPEHPLTKLENVVMSPHAADATPEGFDLLNATLVDNIIAFAQGRPRNLVAAP